MGLKRNPVQTGLRPVVERSMGRELPGLLMQLGTGTPGERRWAARDLAEHPEAAPALGRQLALESDSAVREALFTTLSTIATPEAASVLMPLLRSEDAKLRNGAIEALADMPQAVGPHVDALLRDADPDVRILTVNLLGELKHPDINRWLHDLLEREQQVNVVAAAVEVLAEAGAPTIVPTLKAAVARFKQEPFLQFAADMAIERIESI